MQLQAHVGMQTRLAKGTAALVTSNQDPVQRIQQEELTLRRDSKSSSSVSQAREASKEEGMQSPIA